MQIQKDDYFNFIYVIKYLKENLNTKTDLKLARIISSYDELFGRGLGYKAEFVLIEEELLKQITPEFLKCKKDIYTINLLQLSIPIRNPQTNQISYCPTKEMEEEKERILSMSKVIFKTNLTDENAAYSSMEEIPFVKNNMILDKILLFDVNNFTEEVGRNIVAPTKKETREINDLLQKLYISEKEKLISKINSKKEALETIKAKIELNSIFNENEEKIINNALSIFEKNLDENSNNIIRTLKLTNSKG